MRRSLRFSTCFAALILLGGCASARPVSPRPDIPHGSNANVPAPEAARRERILLDSYRAWEGTPHRYGGTTRSGVDCSGFVLAVFRDALGESLPRSTTEQVREGDEVSRDRLAPGDLVFFRPGGGRHVGIYVGGGQFMHASESQGVTISDLDERYWDNSYWTARRVLPEPQLTSMPPMVVKPSQVPLYVPTSGEGEAPPARHANPPPTADRQERQRRTGW